MKRNFLITTGIVLFSQMLCSAQAEKRILNILDKQISAWNNGDIEEYMQGYWQHDSLKFIGKNGISYGWRNTLQNYKNSYPDKLAMGTLSFQIITLEKLSRKSAYVIGTWSLDREQKEDLKGYFTLLFKKIKGNWLIVADHSS